MPHELTQEVSLKILAHNNLCGRLIGKSGSVIKKIMEDTDTRITVSSQNDIGPYNMDRIVTIKGELESMVKAESIISGKLRLCFDSDMQSVSF